MNKFKAIDGMVFFAMKTFAVEPSITHAWGMLALQQTL